MQKILITGGSGGIGYALARVVAAHGHDVVLAARNIEQLKRAQTELRKYYRVHVDVKQADLSKPGAARKLYDELKGNGIEILVNNASFGLVGDFFQRRHRRQRRHGAAKHSGTDGRTILAMIS